MWKCSCSLGLCVGICVCGAAIINAEVVEFTRPSAAVCYIPAPYPDLVPLPGCDDPTLPHTRMGWLTTVAASTATATGAAITVVPPIVTNTFRDSEDAAEAYDNGLVVTPALSNKNEMS